MNVWRALVCMLILAPLAVSQQESPETAGQASNTLRRAVAFFHDTAATEGGYLWRYSADLAKREGEGKADDQTIWVQPPGTPSVGQAILHAYRMTNDELYLDAARGAAMALVKGQLRSGGWDYRIHFDGRRKHYAYRVDPQAEKQRNVSTLDDNTTQSATRFLMQLDQVLEFEDNAIHESALFALNALLEAQYPNGAWPQRFNAPPDPAKFPIKNAAFPETWPRTHPKVDYRSYYTFNDNTIADTIALMFDAAEIYDDQRYRASATRAADFILLAQMPDPQPAWAQQYNADMEPAWARKFEPASITGGESQGIMRTLIAVYRRTGDAKYLVAVDRALAYLNKSVLPNGQLARFYELRTNTPLYFTIDYKLTYDDSDMPTHYAFKIGSSLAGIEQDLEKARNKSAPVQPTPPNVPKLTEALRERALAAVHSLDERGAWVEQGRLKYYGDDDSTTEIIDCATFNRNVRTLADFIAAIQP